MPQKPQMNYWDDKWDLQEEVCPCDMHFNDWAAAEKLTGRTIFHFGTGTHHVIGRAQAENGSGNSVLAITASVGEYESYIKLVSENVRVARSYLAYFGDIYLTNPKLLPDGFDVVTLFHLCEFFQPSTASAEYGGLTDLQLANLFTDKTKPGGYILFYMNSMAFHETELVLPKWEKERPVERVGEFKTLLVYRKTG